MQKLAISMFFILSFGSAPSSFGSPFMDLEIIDSEIMFQPESSVPKMGLPLAVPLNKSLQKTIRVKVFPHDLKSDWVHGIPDNPKKVSLEGKELSINKNVAGKVDLSEHKGKILARLDNGVVLSAERAIFNSSHPIKVKRENNPDKSHSYTGMLEAFVKRGKIQIVNHINIETYLKGVVPKEAVHTWPLEALKAQAVAARSYAYYHLLTSSGKYYDVDDTARFQVYAGHSARTPGTDAAVKGTTGQVLTHEGKVIVAFFHAYSGGRTDSAKNIFGNSTPYCQGGEEIFSREELRQELPPKARWIVEWQTKWQDKDDLLSKFKQSSHSSAKFRAFESSKDFYVEEADFNQEFASVKTLKFVQDENQAMIDFKTVRKVIGWANFPSYHYRLLSNANNESGNDQLSFKGHGWGHHVGLSQWGAFMMAKNYGKTYEEILHHYYTNVKLQTL